MNSPMDFLPLFQCTLLKDQVCSKPEYDKARASGCDDETACGESLLFEGVEPSLAALIVRAANEHDALCALADFVSHKLSNHGGPEQWVELNRLCAGLAEIRGKSDSR